MIVVNSSSTPTNIERKRSGKMLGMATSWTSDLMQHQSPILLFLGVGCLSLIACKVKQPNSLETGSVQWVKHHVTVGGKGAKNPLTATTENIEAGKQIFGYYCVECHGRDGQNTGVPFAASMSPPVPSLLSADTQRYTDGQLKWIIENGISPSGMPASKGILNDDEMWHIVIYLRHLPPVGSLGEPRAYDGDEFENPEAGQPK
jgi:mono/diheme cytochrome c family protein